jgi:hypothetical protein
LGEIGRWHRAPASESLKGRNPLEIWADRRREHYGDFKVSGTLLRLASLSWERLV